MDSIIKKLREEKGYTQIEIADKTNVSIRQYQRYECEDAKPPIDKAVKLASIFNVPVEQLFK